MKKIIIVDDNTNVLVILRNGIRHALQCEIYISKGYQEAMHLFGLLHNLDILITDYCFEDENKTGLDLIVDLKNKGFNGKVMLITGYIPRVTGALRDNVDKIMIKPFKFNEIIDWLKTNLEDSDANQ